MNDTMRCGDKKDIDCTATTPKIFYKVFKKKHICLRFAQQGQAHRNSSSIGYLHG